VLDKAGVLVGFNTDDSITDSRIFLRSAGLAVRAGLSRDKALYAMTMAGARMLGLDSRIGSLEAGKDADFVLWSGDPLSTTSIALQTWVDGKKYFDRPADLAGRAALEKEKSDLIARAKKTLELERRRARSGDAEGTTAAPSSASEAAPPAGSQTAPPVRPAAPSRTPEEPERRPAPPVNVTPARPTPGPTPGAGR
jgi:hypothetical protein